MSGEDIDLLPYLFVCFMLSVWYAKHPPVAFVFKSLDLPLLGVHKRHNSLIPLSSWSTLCLKCFLFCIWPVAVSWSVGRSVCRIRVVEFGPWQRDDKVQLRLSYLLYSCGELHSFCGDVSQRKFLGKLKLMVIRIYIRTLIAVCFFRVVSLRLNIYINSWSHRWWRTLNLFF